MHTTSRLTMTLLAMLWCGVSAAQDFSLVPGTVVSHSPKSSRKYVGSPSIAILPNGDYVASHDLFGPGANQGSSPISQVFRSTDRGKTWTHAATLNGQFWSNLFVHENDLYLMGTTKEYGKIIIRKSTDGGTTWTNPTTSTTGQLTPIDGYHTAPMPVMIHEGRIWRAFEDIFAGGGWGNHFRSFVMSAPVDADLLDASNWSFSNALARDPKWLGGKFGGWLEGNIVLTPEGEMVNMLRADHRSISAKIDVDTTTNTVSFDPVNGFIDLPGGEKKFSIRYDATTGKYWTLTNPVLPQHKNNSNGASRNAMALVSSSDLGVWDVEAVVLYHPASGNHAFQYPDWQFDGDDLIVASRTAYDDGLGGADNSHNANFLTFHRIEDFRSLQPEYVLVTETNSDRVMRYQTLPGKEWIPLGTFASGTYDGAPLDLPFGLAQGTDGQVYIGEQKDGGRILRFDAAGNYLDTVAREGVDFVGRPEALTTGPDGNLFLSVAFGADSDRIYKIDVETDTTGLLVDTQFDGGALENPRGLAVDTDGNLYVADRQNDQIRKFDAATGEFLGNLWSVDHPQGLTWDAEKDRLLATALTANGVFEVSPEGEASALYTQSDLGTGIGLVALDDVLIWSDYTNGKLYELTAPETKREVVAGLNGPGHLLEVAKPRERTWARNGVGVWHDNANWQIFWGVPNSKDEIAVFGAVVSGDRTVILERDEVVAGLRFATPHSYAIGGLGVLTVADSDDRAEIEVYAGNHQMQVEVRLGSDTQLMLNEGTSLTFQNALRLQGHDLEKLGDGEIVINGLLDMGGGELIVSGGVVSGSGAIVGSVINAAGTLAPGNSPGRMAIAGDFAQSEKGSLQIEIGGADGDRHDILQVGGKFQAGGALDVVLVDGFRPSGGEQFKVFSFGVSGGEFTQINLPALEPGLAWDTRHLLAPGGGYLTVGVVTPEPSTGCLISTIAVSSILHRPRRRRCRHPV